MRRAVVGLMLSLALVPAVAQAAPDPVVAAMLSAGSTVLPIGIASGLLLTGRGPKEGIRFDVGVSMVALGAIAGPSVGQIYGQGGVDAVVTFILRMITGGVMTVGLGYAIRADDEGAQDAGKALFVLGGIPTLFLGVWDVFGAASAAKQARYREGHAQVELDAELRSILRCQSAIPCALE